MRFDGEWLQCDDQIERPVMRTDILSGDGRWHALELLVDTGADRTVISFNVLESLHAETTAAQVQIGGVGGAVDSVSIETQIRLARDDGQTVVFRGTYSACTDYEALDMSVMGRDLLDLFTLIVDRRAEVIALLGGRHTYTISSSAGES